MRPRTAFAFAVALLCAQAHGGVPRRVVWWLEPYANLTSIAEYTSAWRQWRDNARPGYVMAGSAYAVKTNGAPRCLW